jgi:hypothetical protein
MLPKFTAPVARDLAPTEPVFYRDSLDFEIRDGEAVRGPARLTFTAAPVTPSRITRATAVCAGASTGQSPRSKKLATHLDPIRAATVREWLDVRRQRTPSDGKVAAPR